MQEKWIDLLKERPKFGETVEVIHALKGAGAPESPAWAYKGVATYQQAIWRKGTNPGKLDSWRFEIIKHEPGYNILDKGGLEPTHWRRIKQ